ncbi:MAG TPA: ABC transporter ATP-binding protein [Sedimentibacter sp.]|nr:ABC transporter ATP-binding protein [Sedimentibacter sp.]
MGNTILTVKDLKVSFLVYGGLSKVINGINLRIPAGGRVGLVGESGCGKTTTLKSILKILPNVAVQEGGHIEYKGKKLDDMNSKEFEMFRRKGAGMIFQDPSSALNPVFTIGDQLINGLKNSSDERLSKKELNEKAINALNEVALPDPERIMASYPFQLSGGMRQRVCIASTLAANKEILLADEPGTALDVTIQAQILKLIDSLVDKRNLSLVMVSHSIGVIREITDYVYIMYAGMIAEEGPTNLVLRNPTHPYTVALMECIPKLTGTGISNGIEGRTPDYVNPPKGCRFSPRCKFAFEKCKKHNPELVETEQGHFVACFKMEA